LLWNFAVLLAYRVWYDIDIFVQVGNSSILPFLFSAALTVVAMFSPVAGLLTDIKYSRQKVVVYSSCIIIATNLLLGTPALYTLAKGDVLYHNPFSLSGICVVGITVVVYVVFIINALQFGMDQLHDSPTEDSISFIHWYVWIYYMCTIISVISWNLVLYDNLRDSRIAIAGLCILGLIIFTAILLITFSLCVSHYRKRLFLLEPAGVNPYKLVYKVTKFVYQHKVPLRRSAFTYCTEELPSRMDVGKHKYGGPFTTKQVEDVKTFWGILKVILSIGPAYLLQVTSHSFLPAFARHSNIFLTNDTDIHSTIREVHLEGAARHIFISNGLLSPLLTVICIPLYLYWIRPRIQYRIPGALKRIGLAMFVMTLSLVGTLVLDLVVHVRNTESAATCMFSIYFQTDLEPFQTWNEFPAHLLFQNIYFFIFQHVLSAVANMLLDIAVLEFICSQSPYSMKGLLLGTIFSVKSFFQGVAIASIVPFGAAWKIHSLSCGSGFYLMNIIIGLFEIVIFTYTAKQYKYREVNEPSHEYRYAEEYYSNDAVVD
jgi:peptide/histidine transporter 3/4